MEIPSVNDLYRKCSEKYSIARQRFCSVNDFREVFLVNDRKMVINLLNLTCAEGNKIRPKELWEAIHRLDDNETIGGDFPRDLREFSSLNFLLSLYPDFDFKKQEKPDFVLRDGDKFIGLEITSAISEVEAQVNKVAKYNFGRNKSAKEIKKYIMEKHRNIANKIGFHELNKRVALSPSIAMVDCRTYKEMILEKALIKAKRIRSFSSYSEMWLLIDTESNVCFTEEHDAEYLSKLFDKENISLVNITKIVVINILYKAFMIYDVKTLEFNFIKQESNIE
jgi:hypothetical protein